MKLARIVLSSPEQTASMLETLRHAGITARRSSPIELEIESDETAEQIALHPEVAQQELINQAVEACQPEQPLEIIDVASDVAREEPPVADAAAATAEDYVPEREFVLAPLLRAAKAKASGVAPALAPIALYAKGVRKLVRDANESLAAELAKAGEKAREAAKKLHEAEERILKDEPERFVELLKKDLPRPLKMDPLFARMKEANPLRIRFSQLSAAQAAACGAGAMAAIMLIGFSLAQRPAAPRDGVTMVSHPAVAVAQAAQAAQPAQVLPVAQSKPAATKPVMVAKAKPSPSSRVKPHAKRHARSNDDQEVVTHYYKPNAPQLQRASYNGVRQYSDIQ